MISTILIAYLILVIVVGTFGGRVFRNSGEDFFVASRSIGPFVLFMTIFGTNMSAFSILGVSGEAYQSGVAVFALMGSSTAVMVPFLIYFVGVKVWKIAQQHGYITQAEMFRDRFQSGLVAYSLFAVLVVLMIPYLLIGVIGGGDAIEGITGGDIPAWLGKILICAAIFLYVTFGGVRSTSWVNTLQSGVFILLGGSAFVLIVYKLGGLESAMSRVAEQSQEKLSVSPGINIATYLTYCCFPFSVCMFPHIFMHWLTAKSSEAFKSTLYLYPICMVLVWVPNVVLGVLGTLDFPDLAGPQANTVLIQLVTQHSSDFLAGFLAIGIFAAIMSSLDSQVLSLSTMFSKDVAMHLGIQWKDKMKSEVILGRVFVVLILVLVFVLSFFINKSIFKLGTWSFSGYTALFPLMVGVLYWKRCTSAGILGGIGAAVITWCAFFVRSWNDPGYTVGGTGILPVAVMLCASTITMIVVSFFTKPPSAEALNKFFAAEEPK